MNKQINLVINGTGGVGKSFFPTNFVQYLKDYNIEHCAIDSDHENSTLKRFYPEADFINLEHRREIDRVLTTAEKHDLLVVDCGAASTDRFTDFFEEVDLSEVLRTIDAQLTGVCPATYSTHRVAVAACGMRECRASPCARDALPTELYLLTLSTGEA